MRYALTKFRVHLLGKQTFALHTDHASLQTTTILPHLSLQMARWLPLFTEYNFVVYHKLGKSNILANALLWLGLRSARFAWSPRRLH